jgi:uncharacterized membrane protein YqjE
MMPEVDLRSGSGERSDPTKPLEADKSLGELLSQLSSDFSGLVSTQLELAKTEIKEELARAGKGGGMVAGAAYAGALALLLLSFAAAWGIAAALPAGWAFLIVGVVWAVAAAVLFASGRRLLRAVQPLPPQTKQSLKEDVQWARQQAS